MCAKFNVDSPFVLAVGGQKNGFHIINLTTLEDGKIIIGNHMGTRLI